MAVLVQKKSMWKHIGAFNFLAPKISQTPIPVHHQYTFFSNEGGEDYPIFNAQEKPIGKDYNLPGGQTGVLAVGFFYQDGIKYEGGVYAWLSNYDDETAIFNSDITELENPDFRSLIIAELQKNDLLGPPDAAIVSKTDRGRPHVIIAYRRKFDGAVVLYQFDGFICIGDRQVKGNGFAAFSSHNPAITTCPKFGTVISWKGSGTDKSMYYSFLVDDVLPPFTNSMILNTTDSAAASGPVMTNINTGQGTDRTETILCVYQGVDSGSLKGPMYYSIMQDTSSGSVFSEAKLLPANAICQGNIHLASGVNGELKLPGADMAGTGINFEDDFKADYSFVICMWQSPNWTIFWSCGIVVSDGKGGVDIDWSEPYLLTMDDVYGDKSLNPFKGHPAGLTREGTDVFAVLTPVKAGSEDVIIKFTDISKNPVGKPSATVWKNSMYVAYRTEVNNNVALIHSTSADAENWSTPLIIPDITTVIDPVVHDYFGELSIFYQDADNPSLKRISSADGVNWLSTPIVYSAIQTKFAPSLAYYTHKGSTILVMMWKQEDGSKILTRSFYENGKYITSGYQLPSGVNTAASPSVGMVFEGRFTVVYKGNPDDQIYYVNTEYPETPNYWSPHGEYDSNATTAMGPSMSVKNGAVYCLYKGDDATNTNLYYFIDDGGVGDALGKTSESPTLIQFNGAFFAVTNWYGTLEVTKQTFT